MGYFGEAKIFFCGAGAIAPLQLHTAEWDKFPALQIPAGIRFNPRESD
jgi:hypothetical protein